MSSIPVVQPRRPVRDGLRSFVLALSLKRVGVALLLAVLAAFVLSPIFVTPMIVIVARFMVIALVLVLLFTAAGVWRQRVLPSWIVQLISVLVAAPVMTFLVYLPSVGGDFNAVFAHEGRAMGFVSIAATTMFWGALLAMGALYREREARSRSAELGFALEKSQLERQALDARLKLLQAQIEPHFLFNTLANVQALVESGSPRAGPVLGSLIAYLRAVVPKLHDERPTLGGEVALVRAYLELMQMRIPDRLQFSVDLEPGVTQQSFPPMALLTLVENAVRHGIDPNEQGGRIGVNAWSNVATGALHVAVTDDGAGMRETAAPGTGMSNLRERLAAFYGGRARLEISENTPHGVRAELIIEAAAPTGQ